MANETIVISTPDGIERFRRLAIASALELYAKTGMQANRAYTPKAMMKAAADITKQTFKARDYTGAAAAIRKTLELVGS